MQPSATYQEALQQADLVVALLLKCSKEVRHCSNILSCLAAAPRSFNKDGLACTLGALALQTYWAALQPQSAKNRVAAILLFGYL